MEVFWYIIAAAGAAKGEKLDGIEKAREEGKRNYQTVVKLLAGALAGLVIAVLLSRIL